MKIDKVRPNSNPVFNSITPLVVHAKDELVITKHKRDAIVNRLYEINQENNDQIDFKNIQKIHENQKKTLKRQRSLPNKIVQDQDDNGGLKYPMDRSLFGIKETIYFQIPSSLSLIGSYKCFIYFGGFLWFYFLLFGIVTFGLAMSNSQDSIVYQQMRGESADLSVLQEKCRGALTNAEMFPTGETPVSFGGTILPATGVAYPCGMASKYVFDDNFSIYSIDANNASDLTPLEIDKNGISLKVDTDEKFKRADHAELFSVRDVESESFMNWINTPTLPVWKKLYGTILTNMVVGKYQLTITNNFDASLGTEKTIYFQTANSVGGKNLAFGIVLIVTSFIFLFGTLYLLFQSRKNKVQQEFDPKDLRWD